MGSRLVIGIKVGNWDQGWQLGYRLEMGSRFAIGKKAGNWDQGLQNYMGFTKHAMAW